MRRTDILFLVTSVGQGHVALAATDTGLVTVTFTGIGDLSSDFCPLSSEPYRGAITASLNLRSM